MTVKIIKKHTVTKTINGRKYLFGGMSETLAKAQKMSFGTLATEIFKLEDGKTNYPYRVYVRKPVRILDPKSGEFKLVK